jgi:ketosteroid isomerase-like protein
VAHPQEALVRAFYAARARHDLAPVGEAIAPDVVYRVRNSQLAEA